MRAALRIHVPLSRLFMSLSCRVEQRGPTCAAASVAGAWNAIRPEDTAPATGQDILDIYAEHWRRLDDGSLQELASLLTPPMPATAAGEPVTEAPAASPAPIIGEQHTPNASLPPPGIRGLFPDWCRIVCPNPSCADLTGVRAFLWDKIRQRLGVPPDSASGAPEAPAEEDESEGDDDEVQASENDSSREPSSTDGAGRRPSSGASGGGNPSSSPSPFESAPGRKKPRPLAREVRLWALELVGLSESDLPAPEAHGGTTTAGGLARKPSRESCAATTPSLISSPTSCSPPPLPCAP